MKRLRPFVAPMAVLLGFIATAIVVSAVANQLLKHAPTEIDAGAVATLQDKGVTYVKDARGFVVWDGVRFLVLSQRDPHIGEQIHYCSRSGWFEEPTYGDKFDLHGNYRAGPAPRGMAQFAFKIRYGEMFIDTSRVTTGARRGAGGTSVPKGPFCVAVGVNGAPGLTP